MRTARDNPRIDSGHKYRLRAREWAGRIPICVVYPNSYYIGMSNLGFQCLYYFFASDTRFATDRAFYSGASNETRAHETEYKLSDFYLLAFSISYENDFLNLLSMLKNSGIPLSRNERKGRFPVVIAGGAAITLNPSPLFEVVDGFFIGEVEDSINQIKEHIVVSYERKLSKEYLIDGLSEIDGFLIPEHYEYDHNNKYRGLYPKKKVNGIVRRQVTQNINNFIPRTFLFTPETEFKNMGVIEISRGCRWRCRFCSAAFIYCPVRFRNVELIKQEISRISADCEKIGLLGAVPTDHPDLDEITSFVLSQKKKFSFSSIRIGSLKGNIIERLKAAKENMVTLAPETGSEVLRKRINKPITDRAIYSQIERIANHGIRKVKLYYMIGLPFETEEDVFAIASQVKKLSKIYPAFQFTLSIGVFVPKPHTPFQWAPFIKPEVYKTRKKILENELRRERKISITIATYKSSMLETILTQSTPQLSLKLIEFFLKNAEGSILQFLQDDFIFYEKNDTERFPWDIINSGLDKISLYKDYILAKTSI